MIVTMVIAQVKGCCTTSVCFAEVNLPSYMTKAFWFDTAIISNASSFFPTKVCSQPYCLENIPSGILQIILALGQPNRLFWWLKSLLQTSRSWSFYQRDIKSTHLRRASSPWPNLYGPQQTWVLFSQL